MLDISDDKLRKVLDFIVRKVSSKEDFQAKEAQIYNLVGDKGSGMEFKKHLTDKLGQLNWKSDLSEDELIELAKRINYGPLFHVIAKKISPKKRHDEFPEIAGKFEAVGAPGVGTTTTTANTGAYAIPIGTLAPPAQRGPSYKAKKKKKKKKKGSKKK